MRKKGCSWKVVYPTAVAAGEAADRTPVLKGGWLSPYWCEEHRGWHNGHKRALGIPNWRRIRVRK